MFSIADPTLPIESDTMYKLIQVKYRNNREGIVDDVTLNELIASSKIKQFYRPSEDRWVNIDYDSIRMQENGYMGLERREALKEKKEKKSADFLSRLRNRKTPEKPLTAKEWFEKGFALLHSKGDCYEAIRALAISIQLDSTNTRAYLNRGMAYERMNNLQQAIEDYSRAIELFPQDAKVYYMRGALLWRFRSDQDAITDLKVAADLHYRLAIDFLKHERIAT
jgi:tetratricopeptide (TPR) repeat protein